MASRPPAATSITDCRKWRPPPAAHNRIPQAPRLFRSRALDGVEIASEFLGGRARLNYLPAKPREKSATSGSTSGRMIQMIARRISKAQVPESIAQACDQLNSLLAHAPDTSLEDLQGAVEYLLDTIKAARNSDGSTTNP
jgi:hypothetical protein